MPITLRSQTVKQLGVLLLSPGWEAKPLQVYSHTQSIHQFPFPLSTSFYLIILGGKRYRKDNLDQEHMTMTPIKTCTQSPNILIWSPAHNKSNSFTTAIEMNHKK